MDNQLSELVNRISSLEKQNRFFKRCAAIGFVVMCVITSGGAYKYVQDYGKQNDNTLHAQHAVVVKNLFHQERVTLSHTEDGTWLIMKDLEGETRVKIGIDGNGNGRFQLIRANGSNKTNDQF